MFQPVKAEALQQQSSMPSEATPSLRHTLKTATAAEHAALERTGLVARLDEVDPERWPDVVAGAAAAFRAFENHFSDGTHADFDTSPRG